MRSLLLTRLGPKSTHRLESAALLLCLGGVLLFGAPVLGQEGEWETIRPIAVTGLDEARLAAAAGVEGFLALVPEGDEEEYGFGSPDELKGAALGVPFRVVTISPKAIAKGGEVAFAVVDEWRFPILVRGEAKTLLSVAHVNGVWRAVSLGGAGLARHLQTAQKLSGAKNQAGARFILRIYQLRSDFLLVVDAKGLRLWALPSAQMMLNLEGKRSYSLLQLLPLLSKALDESGGEQ